METLPGAIAWVVKQDAEAVAQEAAAMIEREIRHRPDLLLCTAAGSSPTRTYELLGQTAKDNPTLFNKLRIIKVDEWGGLPMDNPATCEADLRRKLLNPLQIGTDRYLGFQSDAADPEAECERVSTWLARHGPIDISILGVGLNGHLAMNEPAESLAPTAHVAKLAPTSLQHSMLASSAAQPTHGLTLGMSQLLCSRKILLIACGAPKRSVLQTLRRPEITTRFPASFLWLHPDVTLLCDQGCQA